MHRARDGEATPGAEGGCNNLYRTCGKHRKVDWDSRMRAARTLSSALSLRRTLTMKRRTSGRVWSEGEATGGGDAVCETSVGAGSDVGGTWVPSVRAPAGMDGPGDVGVTRCSHTTRSLSPESSTDIPAKQPTGRTRLRQGTKPRKQMGMPTSLGSSGGPTS